MRYDLGWSPSVTTLSPQRRGVLCDLVFWPSVHNFVIGGLGYAIRFRVVAFRPSVLAFHAQPRHRSVELCDAS